MKDPANSTPNLTERILAEQTHLRLPSRPEWIEPTVEYLREKAVFNGACGEERAGNLLIALLEALTNSIVHGNLEISSDLKEHGDDSFMKALAARVADDSYGERFVDVFVDYDGSRCRWELTDQGPGFDVEKALARADSDDPEILLASGRGILLMRSFMDEVRYDKGGRRVIMVLHQDTQSERRVEPRVDLHKHFEIAPIRPDGQVDWQAAYTAVARDLSRDGIGLIQNRLAENDRILIGIYSGDKPIYVPAEVRHCRSLGGDMVELGCRFQADQPPRREQTAPPKDISRAIEQILDGVRSESSPDDDRRAHPRMPYAQRIEIRLEEQQKTLRGYARDLSRSGIAFLTTAELPEEVTIVFVDEENLPLKFRTQIVRCTKVQENFYDVGGRFVSVADGGDKK